VTLRARITLALLVASLVPLLIITLFTLVRLDRALRAWSTPAVERALDASLEVGKETVMRLETSLRVQAEHLARALPDRPLSPAARDSLQNLLGGAAFDVAQVYRRVGDTWRLEDDVRPTRVLAATPLDLGAELEPALATDHVIHSSRGTLAGVAPIGHGRALVLGMALHPGFFDDLQTIGQGLGYYRRFGIVRDLSRLYLLMLVAALFVMLTVISAVVAARIAADMTRPIRELEHAVQQVAEGDLETRVIPTGARELVTLGARFNEMTGRLSDQQAALKQAEREATWREVARRLAHEFKNLLTPMSISLHRLRRRSGVVPEDQRPAVEQALGALGRGVEQMSALAEQFSQYARLPDPRPEPLDLGDVVRSAVSLHEHEGVTVDVHCQRELPVLADPLLLSRAIHNLVLNACEASPAGSTVQVECRAEDGMALVEVLDRGSGIEPYVSTKKRGSGLGLSLVRDVAAQHGGNATLENREQGGARARLSLPLQGGQA
jgi:nitrogen fixation/metabolism regulation signal transduction histidine kinase